MFSVVVVFLFFFCCVVFVVFCFVLFCIFRSSFPSPLFIPLSHTLSHYICMYIHICFIFYTCLSISYVPSKRKKHKRCALATAYKKKCQQSSAEAEKKHSPEYGRCGLKRISAIAPVLTYLVLRPGRPDIKAPCN